MFTLTTRPVFTMRIFSDGNVKITMKLDGVQKYVDLITKAGSPVHNLLMAQWVETYKKFIRARYKRGGDGTWPALRPRTKKRVAKRSRKILIDSRTMLKVWEPKTINAGYYQRTIKKGVRLGYGGGARHPFSRLTIMGLALVHQKGKGRVPKREIVVDPTDRVKKTMTNQLKRAALDAKKVMGFS